MAALTITISNSLRPLGGSPSTKWGVGANYTMTWGVSKWGEGTETMKLAVSKLVTNVETLADTYYKRAAKVVTNSVAATAESSMETLQDAAGYYYVFPGPTTDGDDRSSPTYTSGSVAAQSWTCGAVAAVSWSEQ